MILTSTRRATQSCIEKRFETSVLRKSLRWKLAYVKCQKVDLTISHRLKELEETESGYSYKFGGQGKQSSETYLLSFVNI